MSEYKDYGYHNDEASHTFYYIGASVLSMLDKNRNQCILDIGCGNGHLVNYLVSLGFNAYGTDASDKGITIGRQLHPERFFVQDIAADELPAGLQGLPFDTIISTEVIEHLYDPQRFVDFCREALNTGGEIIISTPYHGYLKNLVLSISNKWDAHFDPMWHGGHIKFWSRATLTKALANAGFTVIAFKGCGRFPYFWKSMIIKAKLT